MEYTQRKVFHKRISQHFEDLEGVETDIDDILVWGTTIEEHDCRLHATLEQVEHIGMTMNPEKYKFRMTKVTYLGHKLTREGVKPDQSKVNAILKMPAPNDKQGVQRLLGMVNYLTKFIPGTAEINTPLRELLKKNVPWHWTEKHQSAFDKIKEILSGSQVLRFYDVVKLMHPRRD